MRIPEEEILQNLDPSSDEIEELLDDNNAIIQWYFLPSLVIFPLQYFFLLEVLDITTYLKIICSIYLVFPEEEYNMISPFEYFKNIIVSFSEG